MLDGAREHVMTLPRANWAVSMVQRHEPHGRHHCRDRTPFDSGAPQGSGEGGEGGGGGGEGAARARRQRAGRRRQGSGEGGGGEDDGGEGAAKAAWAAAWLAAGGGAARVAAGRAAVARAAPCSSGNRLAYVFIIVTSSIIY